VAAGDAGKSGWGGFFPGLFAGEDGNATDPELSLRNIPPLSGILASATFSGDASFGSVVMSAGFSGVGFPDPVLLSELGLVPPGNPVFFGVVGISRDFCGVNPLRRPALEPAGDDGYFCGDSVVGVRSCRFAGVPVRVCGDVRFFGEIREAVLENSSTV